MNTYSRELAARYSARVRSSMSDLAKDRKQFSNPDNYTNLKTLADMMQEDELPGSQIMSKAADDATTIDPGKIQEPDYDVFNTDQYVIPYKDEQGDYSISHYAPRSDNNLPHYLLIHGRRTGNNLHVYTQLNNKKDLEQVLNDDFMPDEIKDKIRKRGSSLPD